MNAITRNDAQVAVDAGPRIGLDAIAFAGHDLARPECVLCTSDGAVYAADWRGGVTRIAPDGAQRTVVGRLPDGGALRPNGIALAADGTFLLAHLGDDAGGVYRLGPGGDVAPVLVEVDGAPLPPTNFVIEDDAGRLWITVSTRLAPRARGYRGDVHDGFIVLVDRRGARIVADGLGYTNEIAFDPSGAWLWVNETFARRTSRMRVHDDGSLGPRETVTEYGAGTFPDGIAFDAEGHAWIASIVSNRVLRVAPDGTQALLLEDADAAHVAWVEAAYAAGTMGRPHLDRPAGRLLRNISCVAFGGPGLRRAWLGCLQDQRLATFDTPVAGHRPLHWWRCSGIH